MKNETNLRLAAMALAILAALASLQSAQARDASHGNTSKSGASKKTASMAGGLDDFGRDSFPFFAMLDLQ